jgi:hypothetical protein
VHMIFSNVYPICCATEVSWINELSYNEISFSTTALEFVDAGKWFGIDISSTNASHSG